MKNIRPLTVPLFLIALVWCLSALPHFVQSIHAEEKETKEPIDITSDRMRSENNGRKIIFSGNVRSVWGELEINSDVLEIYSRAPKGQKPEKDSDLSGGKELDEIVAIGNVDIKKGDRRAKGDRAIYFDKQQKIILTGKPKATAWEAENVIHGREMIFFLEKDRFVVNDRVHLTLFPQNKGPGKRKKSRSQPKRTTALNK